ncbi:ArnT family glycosyltransferase [Actomonas aquatica]|uniref:Glycosyltransferase RgtA/B/C/D-like domain-containing protein n=1 Tax=Actomonas aquatica TaxID=2866162 RepID=A0ABZ1CDR0_9BACT|nr:hypothetical protein [Opitutus sp. WL0086]WRQ89552.1 hypothetical protein K1X11_009035 [Opitutus sp. WL0086]
MPPRAAALSRRAGWGLAALLLLHAVLALWGIRSTGVTNDETAHLTAGYAYWKFGDYRLQPENGNLPQRWAGLALLPAQPRLDPHAASELWQRSEVWLIGNQFFFADGNPIDQLLWRARTWMLFWPLALGGLVFWWSRRLWGENAALFSTALYVVSPTVLANGPLVTSDTTAAFWLLLSSLLWWRALGQATPGRVAASVLATSLAFVAKFSCVLLVPIFAAMALLHGVQHRRDWRRAVGLGALHALGIWVVIWLAFGLRFSPAGDGMPPLEKYFLPWSQLLENDGGLAPLIQAVREWRLLPEAYIEGFAHVRYQGSARDAFLFGDYRSTGWWWFFPATFFLKSTIVELLVGGAVAATALTALARGKIRHLPRAAPIAPLVVFAGVYLGFSILSPLNIGHRHILPLYPILFILAGGLIARLGDWGKRLAIALPLFSLLGTLSVAPHYLTFFNRLNGGPDRAWTKLVDSSLDWGQGLPTLASWVERNRQSDEPVYVSYFGSDNVAYRMPEAIRLAPIYEHYQLRPWAPLEPGLYCIGATMLQDVYSPFRGEWTAEKEAAYRQLRTTILPEMAAGTRSANIVDFGYFGSEPLWRLDRLRFNRLTAYLKMKPPLAVVAHSVLVFRLDAEEVRVVTTGSPAELADLMDQARTADRAF